MPRKTLRSKDELESILATAGLELAEPYDPQRSYPKHGLVLTRCKECGVVAHYQLRYIMSKASIEGWPVCRACYWRQWLKSSILGIEAHEGCRPDDPSILSFLEDHDFDLVEILEPKTVSDAILLVRCRKCGKQSVMRMSDAGFGCSCRSHPNTSTHYAPQVTRDIKASSFDHVSKTRLSLEKAKITPVAEVPELMEFWDDERDPHLTMVYPTGWRGMRPGDGQYRFTCPNGHHVYAFPYTYLQSGCSACRGIATKGTGLFLVDTAPELAAEWCFDKNGHWTPENVRQNSKRSVWWRCLACGHEWKASPRERSRRDQQTCPRCGKIQGSIAWTHPRIAEEWDHSNPISPWNVRPHAKLDFVPLWDCPNNPSHKWRAEVASRVAGAECPECLESGKSRIEIKHFEAVCNLLGEARSGARYNNSAFSNKWSVDISLRYRGAMIAIEYDGVHWHQDKEEVDKRKSRELLDAGFVVVRIREDGLRSLDIASPRYIEVRTSSTHPDPEGTILRIKAKLDALLES